MINKKTTTKQENQKVNDKKYLLRSNRNNSHSYLTKVTHQSQSGGKPTILEGFFGETDKWMAARLTKTEAVELWNRFEPTYLEIIDAP